MNTEPAFAKCHCHCCGGGIEFPAEGADQWITCPHCGKETILLLSSAIAPAATRVVTVEVPARHGVFYYVFWGVISLIATIFILAIGVPALIVGVGSFANARFAAQRAAELEALDKTNSVAVTTNAVAKPLSAAMLAARAADEKAYYMTNHIRLYGFAAAYHKTYSDRMVPGVEFKIQNTGAKTLDRVEVTVFFKDRLGKVVSEETWQPVFASEYSRGNPLKPGYIWQLEDRSYYPAKNVPSEWKEGAAVAKITDIRFADETKP
jgi:hypothetical protein